MDSGWKLISSHSIHERNISLQNSFNNTGFNIIHINPGSFKKHIGEFKTLINDVNVHAVAVSETWYNNSLNDRFVSIPGFTLIRHDRTGKRGGGVAIYLRENFKFRIVKKSSSNAHTEFLFIEIISSHDNLLVGVVYNPPTNKSLDTLSKHLSTICLQFNHVVIAGDFNIDSQLDSGNLRNFRNILASANLDITSNLPTNHVINCRSTQIDYIFTHRSENIIECGQMYLGSFTSHDLLFASYDFNTLHMSESLTIQYRAIDKIDAAALNARASQLDFSEIFATSDVNVMLNILIFNLIFLLNEFAPIIKKIKKFSPYPPWYSRQIIRLIDLRNFHHNASKTRSSDFKFHKDQSKKLNKQVTTMKRNLKYNYFKKKFDFNLPPKVLWNNLRNFGVVKQSNDLNTNFTASEINNHFTESFSPASPAVDYNSEFTDRTHITEFNFVGTNDLEVHECLFSITSNAKGVDDLSIKFIKKLSPTIVPILTYIINNCIMRAEFPQLWKTANVFPLPKVASPNSLDDFRPISVLPCLSKIFEKIIEMQINSHMKRNSSLSKFQSGFRSNHSTTTALTKINNDIMKMLDSNNAAMLVLLDFKKAFDKVPHSLLIRKLYKSFNFSRNAAKLIGNFLSNRKQRVSINGDKSEFSEITSGTPQGSILSALLFSLFIDDIVSFLNSHFSDIHIHLYADDTQIYFEFKPSKLNDAIIRMNEVLLNVEFWCFSNEVIINASKSKAIIIGRNKLIPDSDLFINGSPIEWCDSVRNLGLQMNSSLNSSDHIEIISNQIFATVSMLRQSKFIVSEKMRLHLVKTLVLPRILYCNPIYQFATASNMKPLKRAFNYAVRYIYSLGYYDPVSNMIPSVLGCNSLENYLNAHACIFLHRLVRRNEPQYLSEELIRTSRPRSYKLVPQARKYASTSKCFFSDGIGLWNLLPEHVRRESSAGNFKKECLSFFASVMA